MGLKKIEDKISENIRDNRPGNILAKLFRKILLELGYNPIRFSNRLDEFIITNNSRAEKNPYIKHMARPHIVRKLTNDELTWKVFVEAIFHFISAKKLKITVELTHLNDIVTTHTVEASNNTIMTNDDEVEEKRL